MAFLLQVIYLLYLFIEGKAENVWNCYIKGIRFIQGNNGS